MANGLFLAATESTGGLGGLGWIGWIVYFVVIIGIMYLIMVRPQRKQQKEHDELLASVSINDYVVTTSGFYGQVIDITEDMVIVEFGNNKNCRIPMKKSAITEVEKSSAE
ncbi:MAG: preprotein translocase subunit YajC [Lachnospiraceae bacterium]|nr:preprotein translocase subunit YajC [Lachnospiraceae bacterium]